MAAGEKTIVKIIQILKEEVGQKTALRIVGRLVNETVGNQSYVTTVRNLYLRLKEEQ